MAAVDEDQIGNDAQLLELGRGEEGAVAEDDSGELPPTFLRLVLVDAMRGNVEDAIGVTVQARQHGGPLASSPMSEVVSNPFSLSTALTAVASAAAPGSCWKTWNLREAGRR